MSYQVRIGAYLTGFGGLLCCLSTFPGINSMVNSLIEPTPLLSCFFALQVPKYQQYWMAVVGQVGQEYNSRCQPSASCFTMLLVISSHCNHIFYCYRSLGTDWSRLSLHLRSANENLPTLARPSHDQSSSSSLSSYLSSSSSS